MLKCICLFFIYYHLNWQEIASWPGNLKDYVINEDPHPEVIIKKIEVELEYVQELAVRYLRPPVLTPPGDILITQVNKVR